MASYTTVKSTGAPSRPAGDRPMSAAPQQKPRQPVVAAPPAAESAAQGSAQQSAHPTADARPAFRPVPQGVLQARAIAMSAGATSPATIPGSRPVHTSATTTQQRASGITTQAQQQRPANQASSTPATARQPMSTSSSTASLATPRSTQPPPTSATRPTGAPSAAIKCASTAELLRAAQDKPSTTIATPVSRPTTASAGSPNGRVPQASPVAPTRNRVSTTAANVPNPRDPVRHPPPQTAATAQKRPAVQPAVVDEVDPKDDDDEADVDEDEEVDLASGDEDEDAEDAACAVCEADGSDESVPLLLCDGEGCGTALCITCTDPPLSEVPEGDWFCDQCLDEGNTKRVVVKADRVYRRMMEEGEDFDDEEDQDQKPVLEEASTDDDDDTGDDPSGAPKEKKRKLVQKDTVEGAHLAMTKAELKREIFARKDRRLDMGREALMQEKFSKYLSQEELDQMNWTAAEDSGAFGDWNVAQARKSGPPAGPRPTKSEPKDTR